MGLLGVARANTAVGVSPRKFHTTTTTKVASTLVCQVLLDPHASRTAAADVYAFGVVLLEIMQVGRNHVPCVCTLRQLCYVVVPWYQWITFTVLKSRFSLEFVTLQCSVVVNHCLGIPPYTLGYGLLFSPGLFGGVVVMPSW
jgi:hypothetical protein